MSILQSEIRNDLYITLKEAETAHKAFEKALGHSDQDWARFYADYITHRQDGHDHTISTVKAARQAFTRVMIDALGADKKNLY